jgi:hypothetical protein
MTTTTTTMYTATSVMRDYVMTRNAIARMIAQSVYDVVFDEMTSGDTVAAYEGMLRAYDVAAEARAAYDAARSAGDGYSREERRACEAYDVATREAEAATMRYEAVVAVVRRKIGAHTDRASRTILRAMIASEDLA